MVHRTVTPEFLAALEAAYARLRRDHADLPHVLILAETPHPAVQIRLAHFSHEECVTAAGVYAGRIVFMYPGVHRSCPCVFDLGAEATFTTLAHEAVHALASVRGIKETSRHGSYHNARFYQLAAELGLEPRDGKVTQEGTVVMTAATKKRYALAIAELHEQLPQRYAGYERDDETMAAAGAANLVSEVRKPSPFPNLIPPTRTLYVAPGGPIGTWDGCT